MATHSSTRALECRVGRGRIALDAALVASFGEYKIGARLPLTGTVAYSVGVWDQELVLSAAVDRRAPSPTRAAVGAMLVGRPGQLRLVVEVDAVLTFVEIASFGGALPSSAWQRSATLTDGRAVMFVDAAALLAAAFGAAPGRP
jgi:hypothetical protein